MMWKCSRRASHTHQARTWQRMLLKYDLFGSFFSVMAESKQNQLVVLPYFTRNAHICHFQWNEIPKYMLIVLISSSLRRTMRTYIVMYVSKTRQVRVQTMQKIFFLLFWFIARVHTTAKMLWSKSSIRIWDSWTWFANCMKKRKQQTKNLNESTEKPIENVKW